MNPENERRKAFRPPFLTVSPLISCQMQVKDTPYLGILRDMSLTGLYMKLDDQSHTPEIASRCEIVITLQGQHSKLTIDGVAGEVVRCDSDGVAVSFDAPMEWFSFIATFLFDRIIELQALKQHTMLPTRTNQTKQKIL